MKYILAVVSMFFIPSTWICLNAMNKDTTIKELLQIWKDNFKG